MHCEFVRPNLATEGHDGHNAADTISLEFAGAMRTDLNSSRLLQTPRRWQLIAPCCLVWSGWASTSNTTAEYNIEADPELTWNLKQDLQRSLPVQIRTEPTQAHHLPVQQPRPGFVYLCISLSIWDLFSSSTGTTQGVVLVVVTTGSVFLYCQGRTIAPNFPASEFSLAPPISAFQHYGIQYLSKGKEIVSNCAWWRASNVLAHITVLNLWISPASQRTKHTEHLQMLADHFFRMRMMMFCQGIALLSWQNERS